MTTADLDRLAELDRIYDRLMDAATDQLMPGGKLSRQEAGYRNGRGRRRASTTLREDVRSEAEAFMLRLAETSDDPHARRFAEIARERSELIELRTLLAEAVFDPAAQRRMEKIMQAKRRNGDRAAEPPELVGLTEIADMAGVSRARAHQFQEIDGFPEPYAVMGNRRFYLRPAVSAWLRSYDRKPGRPKG